MKSLPLKVLCLLLCIAFVAAVSFFTNNRLLGHSFDTPADTDTVTIVNQNTIIIHTAALCDAQGFNGTTPLDITVTAGVVDSISPLSNDETPGFFANAESLLAEYVGKPLVTSSRADAVSGATYSSNALTANIIAAATWYKASPFAVTATDDNADTDKATPISVWVALAVTLIACIVPLFVRNRTVHTIQLIANVAILGFWCGQFISFQLMLGVMTNGITDFIMQLTLLVMLIAAFIFPLLGKPQHYCTHICPLGSAQQLAGMLCKRKLQMGPRLIKGLNWFRRLLWAALMVALFFEAVDGWTDHELFGIFSVTSAHTSMLIAGAVFLILSLFVPRPYCRFVCPTGTLFKVAEARP